MSLFKRSVVNEISSNAGVVFSTLTVVWLSVLLVRLLGEAARGAVGADIVLGLAAFSTITALPIICSVSLFIAVLTAVTRNYRESEMVVWFASGLSLADWVRPVLRLAIPVSLLVASLTLFASPWAYRQIGEYRERFEQRSDLSRLSAGRFLESGGGSRVFFADEPPTQSGGLVGEGFARVVGPDWHTLYTAENAQIETEPNGDRFIVMSGVRKFDLKPGTPEIQVMLADRFGLRIEQKGGEDALQAARDAAENSGKGRPTQLLITDGNEKSDAQLMWRIALPIAALNLALLAIPLGAVNPRMGRTGDLLIAGLVALLYMNLINLSRSWVSSGLLDFAVGVWAVHLLFGLLSAYLMNRKLRVRAPKTSPASAN